MFNLLSVKSLYFMHLHVPFFHVSEFEYFLVQRFTLSSVTFQLPDPLGEHKSKLTQKNLR